MRSPKVKHKYPFVLVTWMDASHFQGWSKLKELGDLEPTVTYSGGFLLPEIDKSFIRIAQSYSTESGDETIGDVLVIPSTTIVKVMTVIP